MASTYSSDLKLEIITTGEKAGQWGGITNTNLQILEQGSSGVQMSTWSEIIPGVDMVWTPIDTN